MWDLIRYGQFICMNGVQMGISYTCGRALSIYFSRINGRLIVSLDIMFLSQIVIRTLYELICGKTTTETKL